MIGRPRRERGRSARGKFSFAQFLRDYPVVPVVAVVFLMGVASGYFLSQRSISKHRGISHPEAVRPKDLRAGILSTKQRGGSATYFGGRFAQDDRTYETGSKKNAPVASSAIATVPEPPPKKLVQEFFGKGMLSTAKLAEPKPLHKESRKPRIVFVIDDVGHNKRYANILFSFRQPVTLAILPNLAYSKYFAEEAKKHGIETILHLPLEPEDEENPGPGAVTMDMDFSEIKAVLEKDMASVPGVVGVNNHMGSRVTRDRSVMYLILKELKSRQLFFLDSMTHPNSVGHHVAYGLGLPVLKRDVFLDNKDDFDYVNKQIEEAAQIARKTGSAIAIGHVHENTLLAIKKAIPRLEEEGFEFTTLKDLTT